MTSSISLIDVSNAVERSISSRCAIPADLVNATALSITTSDVSLEDSNDALFRFFAILKAAQSLDEQELNTLDPTGSLFDLTSKVCSLMTVHRILQFFPGPVWGAALNARPGSATHRLAVSVLCRHINDPEVIPILTTADCLISLVHCFLSDPSPDIAYIQQLIVGTILDSSLADRNLLELYQGLWQSKLINLNDAILVARLLDLAVELARYCVDRDCAHLFPSLFYALSTSMTKTVWDDDPLLAIAFVQFYHNIVKLAQNSKSGAAVHIIDGFEAQLQHVFDFYCHQDAQDFVLSSIVDLMSVLSNTSVLRPLASKLFIENHVLIRNINAPLTTHELKLYSTANPDFLLESNCQIIYNDLNLIEERYLLIFLNFLASEKALGHLALIHLAGNALCVLSREVSMNILFRLVQSNHGREYMYLRIPAAMNALVVSCEPDLTHPTIWNQKLQILQALRDSTYPIPQLWQSKVDTAYKYMLTGGSGHAIPEVKSVTS